MTTRSSRPPTADDVRHAAERIRPHARRTPLIDVVVDGRPLLLKLEYMQLGGSFKLRGALNAMLGAGSGGAGDDHVVAASGGNHGLAVATAAALLGAPATVYVPTTVPQAKARRIEAAGAKLIRHGAVFAEAAEEAARAASKPGFRFIHAYDDPAVAAGQGTVTAEIVAEAPDTDALVVTTGGGGLACGTALASGGRRVVTVEPENCRCLYDALEAGGPVDSAVDSIAASATGATRVGTVPFAVLSAHERLTPALVSDEEILGARDRLWEEFRIAVEPAGAAPFAAWLAGRVPGERPCLVICGANTEWLPQ